MRRYLIQFNLGPVQDFIAQARRSRDLWHGSHLLSEISRRAAWAVAQASGQLVFPALAKDDLELQPCPGPLRPAGHVNAGNPPLNVANIVLAEVEGDDQSLATFAERVRDEVQRFWAEDIAANVKAKCTNLIAPKIDAAWDEQVATFMEFAAAWTPLREDYANARQRVAEAIAARKNLRDFEPWRAQRVQDGIGVPKSSLDGARETVLRKPSRDGPNDQDVIRDKDLAHKYRIADGEQLDAVGLVKRAGGEPEQFVPIVNVALETWLQEAERTAAAELGVLRGVCEADKTKPDAVDLARIERKDLPCTKIFRYDASIFLENRLWPTFQERALLAAGDPAQFSKQQTDDWKSRVKVWGDRYIAPVLNLTSKPSPYVACLAADGDGMGKALDRIGKQSGRDGHYRFSQRLAEFAGEARRIVEQEHMGSLVYSGGDDVLAFLPLPRALACAEALRLAFEAIMTQACEGFPERERPTLSVGLGIGHVLESMGDLLTLGRAAEKLAKGGHLPMGLRRNALAVIVDKRSGGTRQWRAQWTGSEFDTGPAERLRKDVALLRTNLSTRKVYQIADTLRRFPEPSDPLDPVWGDMLASEVRRSLARMGPGSDTLLLDDATLKDIMGLDLGRPSDPRQAYQARHAMVADWIDRLLIAKAFAEADPTPRERPEVGTPGRPPSPAASSAAGRAT
jgi:CRISPR-associated protein Cmr2